MARGVSVLRIFVLAALIYLSLYLALVFHLNRSEWAEKELDSGIQRQHKIRLAIEYPTQDKLSRSLNSIDKKANDKSLPSEALGDKTADHNSAVNATEDESLATKNSIDSSSIPSELTINTSLCDGPFPGYPECKGKTRWMSEFWESDPCYAVKGVDGTQCSFVQYLSEVEHWCPVLPWRKHLVMKEERKITSPTLDLSPLLNLLSQTSKFDWIRQRIIHFWPKWVKAAKAIEKRQPFFHTEKSILLYIGALSDKSGYHFAENAFSGGPLGEMVQWSDLISALYVSGHSLEFGTELTHLKEMLSVTKGIGGCPTSSEVKYDTIFIDITGLRQFRSIAKGRFQHYMCLFRVLDSFGTEPTYNYKPWKPSNHHGDHGQAWGNWGLNLRQFMTMFPHTPDNSFLGFAVDVDLEEDEELVKENQALVYGKEAYMWKEKDNYLDTISRYLNVHGTVSFKSPRDDESRIPGFVVNHGILNSTALVRLLKRSKVFVGLGFPYEGPAALEAVAYGCVFLNPRIDPPMHRENTKFFQKKPTDRAVSFHVSEYQM
jgi:alpha-1,3(6)-mannosylglycoprotein beta-1,6-N-acetyl-glucosaminyltransferase